MAQEQLDIVVKLKDEASKQLKQIESLTTGLGKDIKKYFSSATEASKAFTASIAVAGTVTSAFAVKFGNDVQTLNNKIKSFSKSGEEIEENFDRIERIATTTRTPILDVVSGFQRLQMTNATLGKSFGDTERMLVTINKGLAVSGATTAEASSAMLQLSQAYASGRLQGDEFRALSETFPLFMMTMASSMGITIGELKALGSEGLITRDIMEKTLTSMATTVDQKFSDMNITIGQSSTLLYNGLVTTLRSINQETKIFDIIASGIANIAMAINSEAFQSTMISTFNFLKENLPIITGVIVGGVTPAVIALGLAIGKATLALSPFLIAGGLIGYMAKEAGFGMNDLKNIIQGFSMIITDTQKRIESYVNGAKKYLNEHRQLTRDTFEMSKQLYESASEAFGNSVKSIQEMWNSTLKPVYDRIIEYSTKLKNWIVTNWGSITSIIVAAGKTITSAIDAFVSFGTKSISFFLQLITFQWGNAWKTLISIITETGPKIWKVVENLTDLIVKTLALIIPKVIEVGGQIIDGLVQGIMGKINYVIDSVKQVSNYITRGFQDAMQIHSPSQVFADFGTFLMQGLANGIMASRNLPTQEIKTLTEDVKTMFSSNGEMMTQIKEWDAEGVLHEKIGAIVEEVKGMWNTIQESYTNSFDEIDKNFSTFTENHTRNVQNLNRELSSIAEEMTKVQRAYKSFLGGEATDFGSQFVKQEESIRALEESLADAKHGQMGADDDITRARYREEVIALQERIAQEKEILAEANSWMTMTTEENHAKVVELEDALQRVIQDKRSATTQKQLGEMDFQENRLKGYIEFYKERETTLAEEQRRLATGVAAARNASTNTEFGNFMDKMIAKRNEEKDKFEKELQMLTDKYNAVTDALELERKAYMKGKEDFIAIEDAMVRQHKIYMNDMYNATKEKVDDMIKQYERLAQASGSIGGGAKVSGRRATGGAVNGGDSYIVGENGPEVFTPNMNGKIIPNKGMSGATVIINVGTVVGKEEYAEEVMNGVIKTLSRNGVLR